MIDRDRRKRPRYPVKMPVTVAFGEEPFTALVKDISRDAVFVEVKRRVPVGSTVSVTFALPGRGGPLQIEGRVSRLAETPGEGGPGLAIQFRELSADEKVRLEFFIALQGGTPE